MLHEQAGEDQSQVEEDVYGALEEQSVEERGKEGKVESVGVQQHQGLIQGEEGREDRQHEERGDAPEPEDGEPIPTQLGPDQRPVAGSQTPAALFLESVHS